MSLSHQLLWLLHVCMCRHSAQTWCARPTDRDNGDRRDDVVSNPRQIWDTHCDTRTRDASVNDISTTTNAFLPSPSFPVRTTTRARRTSWKPSSTCFYSCSSPNTGGNGWWRSISHWCRCCCCCRYRCCPRYPCPLPRSRSWWMPRPTDVKTSNAEMACAWTAHVCATTAGKDPSASIAEGKSSECKTVSRVHS